MAEQMSIIYKFLEKGIGMVNDALYGRILIIALLAVGLYYSLRTGFVQIRLFGEACRVTAEKPTDRNGTSSFAALMTSTASRVGSGNIIGVSTALCFGGCGAVFWMWLIAVIGAASAFAESTLAQIYKKRGTDNRSCGGPSYYIEQALGKRRIGLVFAVFLILTYGFGFNLLASFNYQTAFAGYGFYNDTTAFVLSGVLALAFAVCIFGGGKRISRIAEITVPVMGILYLILALTVTLLNIGLLPKVLAAIFADAFDFQAIFGGFSGSCLMYGIKRGLFSNEAGVGSAPNAAAAADVSHPVKQGLTQMLSVFIDTLLLCTATAFLCLCSGVEPTAEAAGAPYVQQALYSVFGSWGHYFLSAAMALFVFTTLLGNFYYCEGCLLYICQDRQTKPLTLCFRTAAVVVVLAGAAVGLDLAWNIADVLMGLMALINLPVIFILQKQVLAALTDYQNQKKAGKNPVFRKENIGLTKATDYWN